MKKKRFWFCVLAVATLLIPIFLSKSTFAAAGCPSSNFPYGFICPADNSNKTNIFIGTAPGEGINDLDVSQGQSASSPIPITPRADLNFDLGIDRSGPAQSSAGGSAAPVLMWAWILPSGTPDPLKSTDPSTAITAVGGAETYCPGTGSPGGVGVRYGDNDPLPNTSPVGWNGPGSYTDAQHNGASVGANTAPGGNFGFVNCQDKGKVAYWNHYPSANIPTDTSGFRHFHFTVHLNSRSGIPFCVRAEIAVEFSSGANPFAGTDPTVSHAAKQSEVRCYQMSQPKGTLTISCPNRTYSLTGYDPLNPTGTVNYRVTNGLNTTYFGGTTKRTPPTNGTFTFVANRVYHLEIQNPVGDWIEVDSVDTGGCTKGAVTGQCTKVDINDDGLYTVPSTGVTWPSRSWAAVYEVESGRLLAGPIKVGRQQAKPDVNASKPFPEPTVNVKTGQLGPYTPLTQHIVVQTDREYYNGSTWVNQEGTDNTIGTGGYTCYSGSCNILGVTNAIDGSSTVVAGQPYYFTVQLNNDNPDPAGLDFPDNLVGAPLSLTDGVTGAPNPTGAGVLKGTSGVFYIFGVAPDTGGPTFISTNPYPDFYGLMGLGPACGPVFVPVYYPFSLAPHTLLSEAPTDEAPTNILYQAWVSNPMAFAIAAPAHASFTVQPGGNIVPPVDSAGPWAPGDNYIYNANQPITPKAGDHYCVSLAMDYTTGLAGPFGDVINAANPARDFHCFTVNNKPYFRAVNGSVRAGGDFEGTSCTGGGTLGGWYNNTVATPYGTGSTLSILALLKSSGVASGVGTNTPPPSAATRGSALSFANHNATTATPNIAAESPLLGGNYAPNHCMPKATVPPTAGSIPGNTTPNLNDGAFEHTGNLRILGDTLPAGRNSTVHVTGGDVYIAGNIAYAPSTLLAPWLVSATTSTNNIPSFTLIVDGGNIYVDPSVTQLDGLYIAAKSGAIGGKIYTCGQFNNANSFVPMPAASLFGGCNQQLVVSGAFVANQVNLMRTFGSLRDDQHPGINCSNAANAPSFGSCAGEIFRFSPEMFLSNQPLQPSGNGAVQYDAIASLPPVL